MHVENDRFVSHEACPSCGSRDNFARYASGSGFCFGCGRFEKRTGISSQSRLQRVGSESCGESSGVRPCPDDLGTYYPVKVLEWLSKYSIGVPELIKHNVLWSPSREQLIYQFYGAGKDLVLWQARNFRDGTTHKSRFYTSGSPANVLATYYPREESNTAIIVEDCCSAIKCAEAGFAGVPCFSAAMPKEKLARLRRYYSNVVVWLDSDKLNEARKLATQAALLGFSSKVVHTELDPKQLSIRDYVHG
jgi:hypothetical protein